MAGRDDLALPEPPAPAPPPPEPPGFAFSASARRLDPTANKGEQALYPEPPRHAEAWAAYDEVPEVGSLVSSSSALLSQCRLYAGFVDEQQDENRLRDEDGAPREGFEEQFVADCEAILGRVTDASGGQRGLLLAQAENFAVTGDAYMLGWPIGDDGKPWEEDPSRAPGERWEVVSRGAVGKARGRWTIQLGGDRAQVLPEATVCYRMWRRHPRRPDDTRGWVLQALEAIRDLRIFTMAQRSAGRSSIPAKILVTAQEASPKDLQRHGSPSGGQIPASVVAGGVPLGGIPAGIAAAGGPVGVGPGSPPIAPLTWAQTLERLIGDAVMEVLQDAQSGRAVIPAVLAVAEKYVQSFGEIDLGREIDSALAGLVEQARSRIAETADCPPEMLRGLGETNRWNGAQIADDEYRRYFRPTAMEIADAWTVELLWGGLRALQYPEEQIRRVRVLVDPRGVVAAPDRSKLATEGLKLGAISWAAWRTACGFGEEDAPTPEERAEILAAVGGGQANTGTNEAGEVNRSVGSGGPIIDTTAEAAPVPAPAAEPVEGRRPQMGDLRSRTAASNAQVALSAEELADQLATIEAWARARLEEAAEAALDQALSRGGAKLKTWARRDHDLRALLAGVEAREVAALLGPERARRIASEQFADDNERREDLFAAAIAALLLSFGRIVRSAYERALRLLGISIGAPSEPLPSWATGSIPPEEIDRHVEAGSHVLRGSMLAAADREIFDPVTVDPEGELSSFRVPSPVIRRALSAAGGSGVGPGLTATEEAAGGLVFGPALAPFEPARLGWLWEYGPEPRARPYERHLAISGEIFEGPDDPRLLGVAPAGGPGYPGDHDGCRCDWRPVFAEETEAEDEAA